MKKNLYENNGTSENSDFPEYGIPIKEYLKDLYDRLETSSPPDFREMTVMLLSRAIHGETRHTAQKICSQKKNMRELLDCDYSELVQLCGSDHAALFLKALSEFFRVAAAERAAIPKYAMSESEALERIGLYAAVFCRGRTEEISAAAVLDSKNRPAAHIMSGAGRRAFVNFDIESAASLAAKNGCRKLVFIHSHISGGCVPSDGDIKAALQINYAAANFGLKAAGHIVTDGRSFNIYCTDGRMV